jgi:hypothetical protein
VTDTVRYHIAQRDITFRSAISHCAARLAVPKRPVPPIIGEVALDR